MVEAQAGIKELESLVGYTIYHDLPVHSSMIPHRLFEHPGSGFMILMPFVQNPADMKARMDALYALSQERFPAVRRASGLYANGDWTRLQRTAGELAGVDVRSVAREPPVWIFQRVFDTMFMPLDQGGRIARARLEATSLVFHVARAFPETARQTAKLCYTAGFEAWRAKLLATSVALFDRADALLPALAYEALDRGKGVSASDFRTFRTDFDTFKSLYVDIFELTSKGLGYAGIFLNVRDRAAPSEWSDGRVATIETILKKKAFEREFVLDELPAFKALYEGTKRGLRNEFGHYAIRLDVATGNLTDDHGNAKPFMEFLHDLLQASRMLAGMLILAEKITLAHEDPTHFSRITRPKWKI